MIFDQIRALGLLTDSAVRKVLAQFTTLKGEDQQALMQYLGTLVEFIDLLKSKPKVKQFLKMLVDTALEIGPKKREVLLKTGFGQDMEIDSQVLKGLQGFLKNI
ncbi:MAG: hypothetical protein HQ596_04540 [Candidatus Saganbacteria bacterium]|nr:hypothetical protein [Candidatus Saganbacteria bacterium]